MEVCRSSPVCSFGGWHLGFYEFLFLQISSAEAWYTLFRPHSVLLLIPLVHMFPHIALMYCPLLHGGTRHQDCTQLWREATIFFQFYFPKRWKNWKNWKNWKSLEFFSNFSIFGIGNTYYFNAIINSIIFPARVHIQGPRNVLSATFTPSERPVIFQKTSHITLFPIFPIFPIFPKVKCAKYALISCLLYVPWVTLQRR